MSRSNYNKPFYVDVGTSIVAVRCASNHDVVLEYDHVLHPSSIELAEAACDRINKEAEIGRPRRNCDVGTAEEQRDRFNAFCTVHNDSANCHCPCDRDSGACQFIWAQLPYEAQEGGAK